MENTRQKENTRILTNALKEIYLVLGKSYDLFEKLYFSNYTINLNGDFKHIENLEWNIETLQNAGIINNQKEGISIDKKFKGFLNMEKEYREGMIKSIFP